MYQLPNIVFLSNSHVIRDYEKVIGVILRNNKEIKLKLETSKCAKSVI